MKGGKYETITGRERVCQTAVSVISVCELPRVTGRLGKVGNQLEAAALSPGDRWLRGVVYLV